ncbi:hypothetical protein L3Y34_008324 [Caenorhabditis briggsae]|uniref:Uncharacterized protein n=1 Tax=Caenorhabditis briggsae TaxID=6238 RepID=A0AAE9A6G7_CAEBR|nr:hypothetical protein L3Y34_008324 [Caenorhabditis briggsae]
MKHCILFTTVILLVVYSSSAFPFGENNAEGFQRFKNLLPKELVEAYSNELVEAYSQPKDKELVEAYSQPKR